MRYQELMELTGVKSVANLTSSELLSKLESGSTNIQILGRGVNGAAIKIDNQVYKFWLDDSAYMDFVQYALHNQDNPFLPKFKGKIKQLPAFFVRYRKSSDYVNYIKVEELTPDPSVMNYHFNINLPSSDLTAHPVSDTTVHTVSIMTICSVIAKMKLINKASMNLNAFAETLSKYNYLYTVEMFSPELTLFVQTLLDIEKLGHSLDLHSGNFMSRNNHPVIIDPILDPIDARLNDDLELFNNAPKDIQQQVGKEANTSYKGIK